MNACELSQVHCPYWFKITKIPRLDFSMVGWGDSLRKNVVKEKLDFPHHQLYKEGISQKRKI